MFDHPKGSQGEGSRWDVHVPQARIPASTGNIDDIMVSENKNNKIQTYTTTILCFLRVKFSGPNAWNRCPDTANIGLFKHTYFDKLVLKSSFDFDLEPLLLLLWMSSNVDCMQLATSFRSWI